MSRSVGYAGSPRTSVSLRVHRHDPVAVLLEVGGDAERRAVGFGGQPHHRDRVRVAEEGTQLAVLGRHLSVHAGISHDASFRTISSSE